MKQGRGTDAAAAGGYSIGQVSRRLNLSADTLRYYEKRGLLGKISRSAAGLRRYSDGDLARLRFIRRAQKMNFSLAEIGTLLALREHPGAARPEVRRVAEKKLGEVVLRLKELEALRDELDVLIQRCSTGGAGCPIIEGIELGGPGCCAGREKHARERSD
ncbi:MAG TPA: heavy metal-responsive transcriptional regulator [Gammaproteobacteria bacterium]|nr:heavy metal-responsive transcriptional regulator [Gammaproteobacteria bacterium]